MVLVVSGFVGGTVAFVFRGIWISGSFGYLVVVNLHFGSSGGGSVGVAVLSENEFGVVGHSWFSLLEEFAVLLVHVVGLTESLDCVFGVIPSEFLFGLLGWWVCGSLGARYSWNRIFGSGKRDFLVEYGYKSRLDFLSGRFALRL